MSELQEARSGFVICMSAGGASCVSSTLHHLAGGEQHECSGDAASACGEWLAGTRYVTIMHIYVGFVQTFVFVDSSAWLVFELHFQASHFIMSRSSSRSKFLSAAVQLPPDARSSLENVRHPAGKTRFASLATNGMGRQHSCVVHEQDLRTLLR